MHTENTELRVNVNKNMLEFPLWSEGGINDHEILQESL